MHCRCHKRYVDLYQIQPTVPWCYSNLGILRHGIKLRVLQNRFESCSKYVCTLIWEIPTKDKSLVLLMRLNDFISPADIIGNKFGMCNVHLKLYIQSMYILKKKNLQFCKGILLLRTVFVHIFIDKIAKTLKLLYILASALKIWLTQKWENCQAYLLRSK